MAEFKPIVSVETEIGARPSKVWDVLTHKTGVMFMGATVKTDWREGHSISFAGTWKGKQYEDKGVVKSFDPERRLAFTHFSPLSGKADSPENYNLVSIELEPLPHSTHVTLTQSIPYNSEQPSAESTAEYEKNWEVMLNNLKFECER